MVELGAMHTFLVGGRDGGVKYCPGWVGGGGGTLVDGRTLCQMNLRTSLAPTSFARK